jgi:hypothetical protein
MRRGYALLMVVASVAALLAVVVSNAVYTRHLQQQADLRWCALLTSLDSPQAPATTERGLVVQRQMHKLRTDLGCDA